MVAVLGAMRMELKGLCRCLGPGKTRRFEGSVLWEGQRDGRPVVLVKTGCGRFRAERAAELVLDRYPVRLLISAGFAGALSESLAVGDLVVCSRLKCCSARAGRSLQPVEPCPASQENLIKSLENGRMSFRFATCVTADRAVRVPEAKRRLAKSCNAEVVDMESYWVCRAAANRNVPFLSIRCVSDGLHDRLPPVDTAIGAPPFFALPKAVAAILLHPRYLPGLPALYKNAALARDRLTECLCPLVFGL